MKLVQIQQNVVNNLEHSAICFLNVGIELFEKYKKPNYYYFGRPETSIANLGIAIELMLKALIAKKSFAFVFKGLSDEIFMKLTYAESFNKKQLHSIELHNLEVKTIELNEAIGRFYILFPDKRQEFKPYFSFLSGIRNTSVHAYLQTFQRYELLRVAYLALKLVEVLKENDLMNGFDILIQTNFLNEYKEEQVVRVNKAVEEAKNKMKQKDFERCSISMDEWEYYEANCPICDSGGILEGYTEFDASAEDGSYDISLFFFANSFECDACGLQLFDSEELQLVGMEISYDRHSDLDRWLQQNGAYEE